MAEIPGSWDIGPHDRLPVEDTWRQFVRSVNGGIVGDLLSLSPSFENADYIFMAESVVAELKEVETEFTSTPAFRNGLEKLLARVSREEPNWRPWLLGGDGNYPLWFHKEFLRLVRPPVSRILKKANRQIRETKKHFGIASPTGILLFVNDGFASIAPNLVHAIASDILVHSYTSIDCFVYLTVNRYVEIAGSDVPRLVWLPAYSDRAEPSLADFVNDLGRKWFRFLDTKIGPFTAHDESEDGLLMQGSFSIVVPASNGP